MAEYAYHHNGPYEKCDEIRFIQERLNTILTFRHLHWNRVNPDGVYGRRTRDAVRGFQQELGGQYGLTQTGNLDSRTQQAIISEYNSYVFSHPNNRPSYIVKNTAPPISAYTVQGYRIPAIPKSAFPASHEKPQKQSFVNNWKKTIEDIYSCLSSLFQSIIDNWANYEITKVLFSQISDAVKKHKSKFTKLGDEIQQLGHTVYVRLDHLVSIVAEESKSEAIEKAKQKAKEISEAKGKTKIATAGKVLKFIDWAIPTCEFLYASYCYLTAAPADLEKCEKDFYDALDGLLKQICNSIITKIIEIVATRVVTAAIAGSVVPGAGNAVGAIIGIVMSVIDIILYIFCGKTIGDYIWDAISPTLKEIGNKVATWLGSVDWEKAIDRGMQYYQAANYNPLSGIVSHNPLL